jgi:hypothetical protein
VQAMARLRLNQSARFWNENCKIYLPIKNLYFPHLQTSIKGRSLYTRNDSIAIYVGRLQHKEAIQIAGKAFQC